MKRYKGKAKLLEFVSSYALRPLQASHKEATHPQPKRERETERAKERERERVKSYRTL